MKFHYTLLAKIGAATLTLASVLVISSGSVASASNKGTTYNIASIVPLSTAAAPYGVLAEKLDNLALANIKKNHTISGSIKNYYYDSQALPAPAVTAAEQAISIHHVCMMQVLFTSPVSAVVPIAGRDKVLEINPGATGPSLYNLSPYLLSVLPLGNQQIDAFAPYAVKQEGYTRWVVLYTEEPLGEGLEKAINTDVPKAGGTVLADVQVSPTATDYSSQVSQIASAIGSSGKNTMVYLATSGDVSGNNQEIMDQLVADGVNVEYGGFADSVTPALQADPNAGSYQYTSPLVNLQDNNAVTKQFISTLTAKYPTQLNELESFTSVYNNMLLVADGIHHLQLKKKPVTGQNLIEALRAMGTIQVVGGAWKVEKTGTVSESVEVEQLLTGGASKPINVP
jgi:ABC-type branched-subunit amino acid transport system substrate-binding protein